MTTKERKETAILIREIAKMISEIATLISEIDRKDSVIEPMKPVKAPRKSRELISLKRAAEMYGCSRRTLYNLTWDGKIKAFRTSTTGNKIFISVSDLQKYIDRKLA